MFGRGKKPKQIKEKRFRRIRFVWRLFKWGVVLGCIGFTAGWWYLNHLSKWAEEQFSRSHRWNLPTRVYSDVEYLYPGLDIASRGLKAKLDRLGYRNIGAQPRDPRGQGIAVKGAGEYAFTKEGLEVYLHDFDHPLEKFAGFPVRVLLSGNAISSMKNTATDEAVNTVKLEPELIASIFDEKMEDRTLVTLKEVPDTLLQAIVLVEDERFFRHKGVDPWGILRAAFKDIMALKFVEGGSTLTQQLVKNYFLDSDRTFKRKIKEALIALALERSHSKSEILEAYLNEIYLGQRGKSSVSGVGEASRLYFGKDVSQLSLSESALLAGMIRSPNEYSPFRNKDAAKARRDFVLARMFAAKLVSEADYNKARVEPIITPERATQVVKAPYFIDFVKRQLKSLYSDEVLQSEGLRIFTTLDMTAQVEAERAVREGLGQLELKYGKQLPADHAGQLQGALISLQPQTGYIRALVGGRSFDDTKFNRVVQAKRQPGSTFKPFVYLTAFDPKRSKTPFAPSYYIDDTSFTVRAGDKDWTPLNYDKTEHGHITIESALVHSYNIATARLAIDAGLDAVVQTARDAGITSDLQPVPSLALGAFEVAPLEMASAYTIFANNGIRAEPLSIMYVVTKDGQVLEKKAIEMERKFDPGPVYLTTTVLKKVFDEGTAAAARAMGYKGIAAGKTGTTSNYRDAWFVGFTPELLTLTWVGYDDNSVHNMSGARAALPLWVDFMRKVGGETTQDFPAPSNVVLVKIDPESGMVWTKHCPREAYALFVEGAEPEHRCPLHDEAPVTDKERLTRY